MSLLGSLGLDEVSADPNDIPAGKYDGVVDRSEYVLNKDKGSLQHAITYKVTEGEHTGATKQQWYTLYEEVKDEAGEFPEKIEDIRAAKPVLEGKPRQYYKKLYVDLAGIPEDQVSQQEPGVLTGKPATFGVASRNGYKNISFVEGRTDTAAVPQSVDPFGGTPSF